MARNTDSKTMKGSVFVVMIGDEGAVLIQIQKGRVLRRLFAQSPDPLHVRSFEEALDSAPNAPVTLLFDMMDQSYVRQTLPPVSALSTGKIIQRRLAKDFSPEDIKGYIILDREKTGRKDWNYMMVSLASNAILQKWIIFFAECSNPFRGMGLVPLECQRMIQAIEKKFQKDKDKGSRPMEWQILVSHNKVGGFRQIVLRDGKLMFTRMAQPFGESLPAVIAGNIEQEMINTIEYLKRFGLQDPSSISITIVCAEDIKQAIDPKNIKAGERHLLTPYELANLLSLHGAAQPENSFGDVVISTFIAKSRKLILPLHTTYTKKIALLYLFIKSAKLSAALAILAILAWMGTSTASIMDTKHSIEDLDAKHATLNASLNKIKSMSATLPKNINNFTDIMNMSQTFVKNQYDTLQFIEKLADSIKNKALINTFKWTITNSLQTSKTADNRQILSELELHLTAPANEPAAKLPDDLKSLMDSLKTGFPNYDITNPDIPGITTDNKDIKTIIGDTGSSTETTSAPVQNTPFKITLTGPLNKPK